MRVGLQERYTIAIGGLVFAVLALIWMSLSMESREFSKDMERATSSAMGAALQRQGEKQALALATSLADRLVNGLYHLDVAAIERAVAETRKYPGVLEVQVVDPRGTALHDGTRANAEFGSDFSNRFDAKVLETLRPATFAAND